MRTTSITFTDRILRQLKPPLQGRDEFIDAACPGLRLRVSANGRKTFTVMRRIDGRNRRITLGAYPDIALADARRAIHDNPTSTATAASKAKGTFGDLVRMVIADMEAEGKRSVGVVSGYLLTNAGSAVDVIGAETPAANVTPEDVTRWLRTIAARGVSTGHPRAFLHAAFQRAIRADNSPRRPRAALAFGITSNPVAAVGGRQGSVPRDRCLTLSELAKVWQEFPSRNHINVAATVRMIIAMGGVRVEDVCRLRVEQLEERDGRTWITWSNTNNRRPHSLPMTRNAAKVWLGTRDYIRPSPFVFPAARDPSRPMDAHYINTALKRWVIGSEHVEPFQPRDLRRTMKTHINDAAPLLDLSGAIDRWHNRGVSLGMGPKHDDRATSDAVKLQVADVVDRLVDNIQEL